MSHYTEGFQQGFVFLKEDDFLPLYEYKDMGIDFNILNQKRFNLMAASIQRFPRIHNENQVNSIMRPLLPGTAYWWNLRMP